MAAHSSSGPYCTPTICDKFFIVPPETTTRDGQGAGAGAGAKRTYGGGSGHGCAAGGDSHLRASIQSLESGALALLKYACHATSRWKTMHASDDVGRDDSCENCTARESQNGKSSGWM
eukprot:3929910-Pleurochrysis_carterae.AAC.3